MDSATFGVKTGEHIPGTVVNAYLNAYAAKFHIADLIRFNTKVTAAKHCDIGGWELSIGEGERVFARRLILATGLTSTEFLPHFEGQETFGGLIFHSKHFLQNKDTIEQCKSVTVFGGGKFAWDAVYLYAMAGVKVNWVIRCKLSINFQARMEAHCIHSFWPWSLLDDTATYQSSEVMARGTWKYVHKKDNSALI